MQNNTDRLTLITKVTLGKNQITITHHSTTGKRANEYTTILNGHLGRQGESPLDTIALSRYFYKQIKQGKASAELINEYNKRDSVGICQSTR